MQPTYFPTTYSSVSIQAISKNVLLKMQQAGHTELLHEIMGTDNDEWMKQPVKS
ncbi:MAG: hypothetical protein U1E36_07305 [Rickettsiales bacterium]